MQAVFQLYCMGLILCHVRNERYGPDPDPDPYGVHEERLRENRHADTGDFHRAETVRFKERQAELQAEAQHQAERTAAFDDMIRRLHERSYFTRPSTDVDPTRDFRREADLGRSRRDVIRTEHYPPLPTETRTSNQSSSTRSSNQSALSVTPREQGDDPGPSVASGIPFAGQGEILSVLSESVGQESGQQQVVQQVVQEAVQEVVQEAPITLQLRVNENEGCVQATILVNPTLAELGYATIPTQQITQRITQRVLVPICNQLPDLKSNNFSNSASIIPFFFILIAALLPIKDRIKKK